MTESTMVLIKRTDLAESIKFLNGVIQIHPRNMQLRIDFADGEIRLFSLGIETKIPASGSWEGFVTSDLLPILTLKNLPDGEIIKMEFKDGRLFIGGWSIKATHESNNISPTVIPLNPSLKDLVKLKYQLTDEQINASAMRSSISKASDDLKIILLKAQDILRPVGISLPELEEFIEKKYKSM
jgi:hypothetical protein